MQAKAIARKKKQKKTTVVPCVLAPRYLSRCFLLCICCTLFLLYREFVFSSFAICIAIFLEHRWYIKRHTRAPNHSTVKRRFQFSRAPYNCDLTWFAAGKCTKKNNGNIALSTALYFANSPGRPILSCGWLSMTRSRDQLFILFMIIAKRKITKNIAVSCIDEKHFWSETSLTVAPCTICSNVTCKNEYPALKSKGKTNGSDIRFHSNFGFIKSLRFVSLKLAGRSMLNDHTHQTQLVTGRVTTISCLCQSCPVINEGQINS